MSNERRMPTAAKRASHYLEAPAEVSALWRGDQNGEGSRCEGIPLQKQSRSPPPSFFSAVMVSPGGGLALPAWYVSTITLLCVLMLSYTLLFPATLRAGFSDAWAARLEAFSVADQATPNDVLTKYKGERLVVTLHQLPSAVWSAALPLQLSAAARTRWPALHRAAGWAGVVSSLVLASGVVLITHKGLSQAAKDNPGWWRSTDLLLMTAWLLATALLAVRAAKRRRFAAHRAWMLRHIASGVWVILQRGIIGVLDVLKQAGITPAFTTDAAKVKAFNDAGAAAMVITVLGTELLLWNERGRAHRLQARSKSA